jgi:hypothetical protein
MRLTCRRLRYTHFTCFTGTKVQILTQKLQAAHTRSAVMCLVYYDRERDGGEVHADVC